MKYDAHPSDHFDLIDALAAAYPSPAGVDEGTRDVRLVMLCIRLQSKSVRPEPLNHFYKQVRGFFRVASRLDSRLVELVG